MTKKLGFLLRLLVVGLVIAETVHGAYEFSRYDFPPGFVFGITSGANGDIACDQYHKYKIVIMSGKQLNLDLLHFGLTHHPPILFDICDADGRGSVNPKGLQYYNNLINELISHGIEPHVTLHHFDLPQALEDERDFAEYADVCFKIFGDRVKYWTTFNEANIFSMAGYDLGFMPPSRCSSPFGFLNCTRGDSLLEPYLAAHNILLSHASATRLYWKKYQNIQKGYIGLNLLSFYSVPFTNKTEDVIAARRVTDFFMGWFVEPLVYGDYPEVMKNNAGSRLPSFTALESQRVKGSFDFFAVNFYSANYVKDNPESLNIEPRDYFTDMAVQWKCQRMQRNTSLEDWPRIQYLQEHISVLLDTVRNGSNAKGYFTWSLLDVFELLDGYRSGYGLYYVDLDDPELRRYPKLSAKWYSRFLKGGSITPDSSIELDGNWSSLSSAQAMR
ncbi:hypothetical protein EUGRSUZ_J00647 [Eucalyptus grandis]|uniref:Thioglucosidase n=2 Tax=Eucalyptus grandis TaxID=71139 RepID=A0A059AAC9_EUCGR|nr:hypothetical protein EUGRSUZ_J00647 [Eucalyptus grandis]